MVEQLQKEIRAERRAIDKKLEAIGWGVFFIWIGIVFLAGIGIITLGTQVARVAFGLRFEGFWLVVGSCFLLGGMWQLVQVQLPLLPILLILAGLALILAAFRPESWRSRHA